MEIKEVLDFIINAGVPAAIAFYALKCMRDVTEQHHTESMELTKAIDKNSGVIGKLITKLDLDDEVNEDGN